MKSDSIKSSDNDSTQTNESDHPGHLRSLKERMEKPHRRTLARGSSFCIIFDEEEGNSKAADANIEAIWAD
jgi:hypothetical protein